MEGYIDSEIVETEDNEIIEPGSTGPEPTGNQGAPQNSSGDDPGKNSAIGSLVLGIIGVVLWFTGIGSIISAILGIIGLVLASSAKKAGYTGSLQMAGFVLSLLALIFGCVAFACAACMGAVGCAALMG